MNWICKIDKNTIKLIDLGKEYGLTKQLSLEELNAICEEFKKIDGADYIACYEL